MQLADRSSVVLLPMHKDGYTGLCQIITESKRSSEKGFSNLTLDTLELYNDDLIAFALPPWTAENSSACARFSMIVSMCRCGRTTLGNR